MKETSYSRTCCKSFRSFQEPTEDLLHIEFGNGQDPQGKQVNNIFSKNKEQEKAIPKILSPNILAYAKSIYSEKNLVKVNDSKQLCCTTRSKKKINDLVVCANL